MSLSPTVKNSGPQYFKFDEAMVKVNIKEAMLCDIDSAEGQKGLKEFFKQK
jgi:hypothetical protein